MRMIKYRRLLASAIVAFAAVTAGFAQSFEFRMDGERVEDGETVTFTSVEDELLGTVICETSSRLSLYNLTTSILNYTGTVVINSNEMEATGLQICMGGLCQQISGTSQSFSGTLFNGGSAPTLFDAYPQKDGTLEATLTVTSGSETISVNILFLHGSAATGIDAVETSAGDALYDVYTLSGNLLRSGVAQSAVRSLPKGLYVVRQVGANGSARKLAVR